MDGEIFVVGSNQAGRHGAGAALIAKQGFGAKTGVGQGRSGNSYLIPTKTVKLITRRFSDIEAAIEQFVKYTQQHPELRFFVTRVACELAGHKDWEIAPLFKAAINCSFAYRWRRYLEEKSNDD